MKTIPGEETILLAHSGLTLEESDAIRDSLQSKYGERHVKSCGLTTDRSLNGLYCHELTMTYEFNESSIPAIEEIYGLGFGGVRINGRTATCKLYFWVSAEQYAEEFASAGYGLPLLDTVGAERLV